MSPAASMSVRHGGSTRTSSASSDSPWRNHHIGSSIAAGQSADTVLTIPDVDGLSLVESDRTIKPPLRDRENFKPGSRPTSCTNSDAEGDSPANTSPSHLKARCCLRKTKQMEEDTNDFAPERRAIYLKHTAKCDEQLYLAWMWWHPGDIDLVWKYIPAEDRIDPAYARRQRDWEARGVNKGTGPIEGKQRNDFPKATWGDWSWESRPEVIAAPPVGPRNEQEPGVDEQMIPREPPKGSHAKALKDHIFHPRKKSSKERV